MLGPIRSPLMDLQAKQSKTVSGSVADLAQPWTRILTRYREPHHGRSILEISITLVPFGILWASAWAAVHCGYWEL